MAKPKKYLRLVGGSAGRAPSEAGGAHSENGGSAGVRLKSRQA
jgi:hypothetical protein